jgi:hypothetical protein
MSNQNPWPGYNEYEGDADEDSPEFQQEMCASFRACGDKPESIVNDDKFKALYTEYLKKNPQVEKADGQEKP